MFLELSFVPLLPGMAASVNFICNFHDGKDASFHSADVYFVFVGLTVFSFFLQFLSDLARVGRRLWQQVLRIWCLPKTTC